MWQDPPEPPKPKKKKTKTQLDDEGNEVVIELSEDESSDEEEQVNHPHDCMPTTPPSKLTYSVFRSPFSAVFCVPVLCPRDPGAAPPSHHPEHPALLRGGGRQPGAAQQHHREHADGPAQCLQGQVRSRVPSLPYRLNPAALTPH